MNDELRQINGLDPEWVKRERRREIRFWTSLALAILAIGGATWAIVRNNEQDKEIVQVSACQVHPAGSDCQKAKLESAKAANLHVTCVPFEKAGYRCPKPGSRAAHRAASQGGDALQPGSTGHQPSGPPQGGRHDEGSSPESAASPAAPTSGDEPVSGVAAEVGTPTPAETASTAGALSPTVEKLPEPAKQTVERLCSLTDHLAHLC